ncbi:polysaccharide deacetylase family protein [Magnetococcus sp. PR-3]|uniref:polysaccharide deacetylase family protein n=1 Tax=Magnetococcus sp. PR-3 TaxID=3120355 RepID=UPI002FCE38E8
MRWLILMVLLSIWLLPIQAHAELKRTILALYEERESDSIRWTLSHRLAEMPLNHLGLKVRYRPLRAPWPTAQEMADVRGILLWSEQDEMPDANGFLSWSNRMLAQGVRITLLGARPFLKDEQGKQVNPALVDQFWKQLGLEDRQDWRYVTFDTRIGTQNANMVGLERPYGGVLPPYPTIRRRDPHVTVHLSVQRPAESDSHSHLITTGPNGGYVAAGYAFHSNSDGKRVQWHINPFAFFRHSFATDDLPKPDTTTLSGRRIYYSHVDGDGWRNPSEIKPFKDLSLLSSEVLLKEIIEKYQRLPVTIAPISGDLDPEWFGDKETQRIARALFAHPQVEAGSHTYSHPLDWSFFENADPAREAPFRKLYASPKGAYLNQILTMLGVNKTQVVPYDSPRERQQLINQDKNKQEQDRLRLKGYQVPRVYGVEPFSVDREVKGSIQQIAQFLPKGKKVKLYQWSGNTLPFEAAVRAVRNQGLGNLNGGDSRFDREFPSFAWVSPLGLQVGKERQIYSSNSNENTYTDLWTDRFFGFQYLVRTLYNTEMPWRIKPINVYYHMYSGQKLSSLNALKKNLDYALSQPIIPIHASHFTQVVDGFYESRLTALSPQRWQLTNHGAMQTLRMDHATFKQVDFTQSQGVVGQRHFHGSLYVHLDPANREPIVALKANTTPQAPPKATRPYLLQGRWQVQNLHLTSPEHFTFKAKGFGPSQLQWQFPHAVRCKVVVKNPQGQSWIHTLSSDAGERLFINQDGPDQSLLHFTVNCQGAPL